MEETINILGDGLQVCVLFQGNYLSDESYTLDQLRINMVGIWILWDLC